MGVKKGRWMSNTTWPDHGSCITCGNTGLCRSDCPIAPWNQDLPEPKTQLIALLRKRRWTKMPFSRSEEWPTSWKLGNPLDNLAR